MRLDGNHYAIMTIMVMMLMMNDNADDENYRAPFTSSPPVKS